jgi:uncharacterized membrane protein
MMTESLTVRDHDGLREHGLSITEVERQLALFRDPPAPLQLVRPCTVGDGIRRLSESDRQAYERAYESARAGGRLLKFVPASGAASRMFSSLLELLESGVPSDGAALAAHAERQPAAADAEQLVGNIDRFAFRDALAGAFQQAGDDLTAAVRRHDVGTLLRMLLTKDGLDYGNQPKALLPFHRYDEEVRTALEEHLVEAAACASSDDRTCRLHFTVSPEHRRGFEALVGAVRQRYESRYAVHYDIAWSSQKPSTDTVAVDASGNLFRTSDGVLLLRPGGHGALLENLNDLQADVVLIKNIDNVTVERRLAETVLWKKLLVGCLCDVQARVFAHLRELRASPGDDAVDAACRFVRDELQLDVPAAVRKAGGAKLAAHLRTVLDRPIRVSGMVPNTGEPGGGPAWVRDPGGTISVQIVERAQIDRGSETQQRIFDALTHFSPVDFACGVRDVDGRCFDLRKFVDPHAVIFAEKSSEGRFLRALEHPGLWNGGMARWLTLFVEVPITTFNPVKTFLDLLRPAHQSV